MATELPNIAATVQQMLSGLTGTADARIKGIQEQQAQYERSAGAIEKLLVANVIDAKEVAANTGAIAAKKAEVDFIRNNAIERTGTVLGMNADEQNYIIPQRMAEYEALSKEQRAARAEYDKLASTDLLSNPVGYIMAQLKLPAAAARNNALVDAKTAAIGEIEVRQRLMTAQKSAITTNTSDRLKEINLAEAQNAQRAAEINLRQAEAEVESKVAGMRMQAWQLGDKAFDIKGDLFNKQIQVQQWTMSFESLQAQREANRLASEERRAAAAERAAILKDRADEKAAQQAELATLNVGFANVSRLLGLQIPMNTEIWKKMPDGKMKQAWLAAAQDGVLGKDLVTSLAFFNGNGAAANIATTNPGVAQFARFSQTALESVALTLSRDPKLQSAKPAEIAQRANTEYISEVENAASNIAAKESLSSPRYDSLFNPYKAQHLVLLDQFGTSNNAMVKALNVARLGKETAITPTGNLPAEIEQTAMHSIIEQVTKGTLGVDDAARQINTYYIAAAKKNFDLYQYTLFGLPAQTKYMFTTSPMGMFGNVAKADLMDFASTKMMTSPMARSTMVTPQAQRMVTTVPGAAVGGGMPAGSLIFDIIMGRESK